ncbi:MAG: YicC family protein, partial [Bacteroidetes bacterium]
MTGYGRATRQVDGKTFLVEIRSLNSKYSDLRLKCAQNLAEKEAELRKLVSDFAQRGKVEMSVEINSLSGDEQFGLNVPLFRKYYEALSGLCDDLNYQDDNLMSAILRLPNVVASTDGTLSDEDWAQLRATVEEALERFQHFRRTEGAAMAKALEESVTRIVELLAQVSPFEKQRVINVRERLLRNLEEHLGKDRIDENRFEQEVLFYLEKMDINEEKVRLEQHCKYFL